MLANWLEEPACGLWTWFATLTLFGAAVLVYLLDPVSQQFESWPLLASPLALVSAAVPADINFPYAIRFWFPDFAWACLAAMFAAEVLRVAGVPAGQSAGKPAGLKWLLVVLAAVSWEICQGATLVPGTFDPVDLLVSAAAGGTVVLLLMIRNYYLPDRKGQ